jgi:two-component system CheB/CheR fusion protein
MAFVVVQHLDPNRHGMLQELLQRITPMVVKQAGNRMKIDPDCIYVIPPNKDLAVLYDTLYLLAPVAPRGLRLPIDAFFPVWPRIVAKGSSALSCPAWVQMARPACAP